MQLLKNLQSPEDVYYEKDFLIVLENHMALIKSGSHIVELKPYYNLKYRGDFYGLLAELNIPAQYHHITSAINGIVSTADYNGQFNQILIPDFAFIDGLKDVYLTKN